MKKLAINIYGVQASSRITSIEIILDHLVDTSKFTTDDVVNREILQFQMEGLICRLADITNDVILKFTITVLRNINIEDKHGSLIRKRFELIKNDTGKLPEEKIKKIEEALSYNLSKLRSIALDLAFPIHEGPVGLILLRNAIVHRNGKIDSDLSDALRCIIPNSKSIFINGKVSVSYEFLVSAIENLRKFIYNTEELIHDTYKVPWTYIEIGKKEGFKRMSKWYYKK